MTEPYRRMVKDMQLRGFAERTQETYLRFGQEAVRTRGQVAGQDQ